MEIAFDEFAYGLILRRMREDLMDPHTMWIVGHPHAARTNYRSGNRPLALPEPHEPALCYLGRARD